MKSRSHRLPTISDTPDDWVDESWTVDCVCGVNFDDGEEMVDCDECGVWVHTRCSRYVKSEKLFACDKCKSKKLRKESEETEVAQLLVELPTKTLRMENPYPVSCPPQNSFQVWTEIPLEEKVHVQGIPGGDPTLFTGVSSVFSPELWKCTGYIPKKFNFQYREFPCWDERQDDGNKGKEEIENHASKGAVALFSLSKENALPAQVATSGGMKTQVDGGTALEMETPTTDTKKQEVENHEGRRQHSGARKERSLLKPVIIHSGNQKKDDSRVFKDLNRKKNAKAMDKEGDSKKRDLHSFESVSTMPSDAKQSESYEGKGPKVSKTDKQSCKHENSRADVQANDKSDGCLDIFNTNNNPISSGQPSGNVPFDDSRLNPSKEAKQMEENDGNQVPPSVEISPRTEDGMASSLKQNPKETITMKDEVGQEVVDVNGNGRSCSRSNGTRSIANNLEKVDSAPNGELHASPVRSIEVKAVEINNPGKASNSQSFPTSDLKLDSSKTLPQDKRISDDPLSASFEVRKEAVSVSQTHKVQHVDKSLPHVDSQAERPDESPCGPSQPKGHMRGSENSKGARSSSEFKHGPGHPEGPSKSRGTVATPSGAPNQCKVTVSAVVKSSVGKPSSSSSIGLSKSSVTDKARYSNTDDRNSSGKQKGACDNNSKTKKDADSSELPRSGDACEKPKKLVKDLPKSLSTSALKSSHLSKSSHAPVSKKNASDPKDPTILSSSKTSSVQITAAIPDSGDSVNSLRCESGAHEQNKSTSELSARGEKINQLNRQPTAKNNQPHVHPPASTNSPAILSDEELALLLHQELNSSPRVPRVPRMRHAGSLPQLASGTSTSTLMKRTSSSGGKDNGLVSRKKNKDLANNGPSNSREFDGAKKVDRLPSLPNSRRHDLVKNGSAKAMHHVDKSAPPASTTVSSGPSSSNEANEHNMSTRTSPPNASDDENGAVGVPTHRTLPGLIADIMSKGKRMTYEELCNAVLPHWPNLRKHNGERYAYSSHSQAVLDCLRNRSEWSRLVDRGPKTNAGRKRRKSEADAQNLDSEEDDYSTDRNTKDIETQREGKQRARKHRRLALQGRGIKDVRRRRKAEVVSDEIDSSSDSSEESAFSDEEMQGGTSVVNEASASSDEMGTMS